MTTGTVGPAQSLRIDKWLWYARFCRSRALAQAMATAGHIRLNGSRVDKPSVPVRSGDILTLPARSTVVVVRVRALGLRRGPAKEAEGLYDFIEGGA